MSQAHFNLDDVRESFTRDMSKLISRIVAAGDTLKDSPHSFDTSADSSAAAHWYALEADGHAIHGTAGLVGATALSASAEEIEKLAQRGAAAAAEAQHQWLLARKIAGFCQAGAETLEGLLQLTLDKKTEAADALHEKFIRRLQAGEEATEPSFDFSPLDSTAPHSSSAGSPFDFSADEIDPNLEPQTEEPAPAHHSVVEPATTGVEDIAAASQPPTGAEQAKPAFDFGDPGTPAAAPTTGPASGFSFAHPDDPAPAPTTVGAPGFSFADEGGLAETEDLVQTAPAGMDAELLEVFRAEAQENTRALLEHLETLLARADDFVAAGHLERIYHTIKGAAATVGLLKSSEIAGGLQQLFARHIDEGAAFAPQLVQDIVDQSNAALQPAGLPPLVLQAPSTDDTKELESVFLRESRDICLSTLENLPQLSAGSETEATALLNQLSLLFHRLKGSALIHKSPNVAREADALQHLCLGSTQVRATATDLRRGVIRLGHALGLSLPPFIDGTTTQEVDSVSDRLPVQIIDEPEIWQAFVHECTDLLETIDQMALSLDASDQPKNEIGALLLRYHTLKGSVSAVGLNPIATVIHEVEDLLAWLEQEPIMPAMRHLSTLLLRVQSGVRRSLQQGPQGFVEFNASWVKDRISALRQGRYTTGALPPATPASPGPSIAGLAEEESPQVATTVRVATTRLDSLMRLTGELVLSRARLEARSEVLGRGRGDMRLVTSRLLIAVNEFRERYEFNALAPTVLTHAHLSAVAPALAPPAAPAPFASSGNSDAWSDFSELELDRYEDINILARVLAEVTDDLGALQNDFFEQLSGVQTEADAFSTLITALQTEISKTRMVPLGSLFSQLQLLVRDAADREAKQVNVETAGSDVNLDKSIVDGLYAPLLHLVRNAVTHGVETPEERESRGKSAVGSVRIDARQDAGQVIITVSDDGAGLNRQRLHSTGVAMGLIDKSVSVDDERVTALVFASGLSTRDSATQVSGRGVGGAVLRSAIERLNGQIQVHSRAGEGTQFRLAVPLTLEITKALLVRAGADHYMIPLYFVARLLERESVELEPGAAPLRLVSGETSVPLTSLSGLLGQPSAMGQRPVVILRSGEQETGIEVDAILRQQEIVVKPLSDFVAAHPCFAGITMLGSGELVLVLDPPGLMGRVEGMEPAHRDHPFSERGPEAPPSPTTESATPLRVLFVDDSLSVRKVAQKFLESLGAAVTLAVDGADGLERLRSGRFDLVLTDLEMPRLHGFEFIRELRLIPAFRDLPVIVVSSRSGRRHKSQAAEVGANDYITKPFSQQRFAELLQRWGGRRR